MIIKSIQGYSGTVPNYFPTQPNGSLPWSANASEQSPWVFLEGMIYWRACQPPKAIAEEKNNLQRVIPIILLVNTVFKTLIEGYSRGFILIKDHQSIEDYHNPRMGNPILNQAIFSRSIAVFPSAAPFAPALSSPVSSESHGSGLPAFAQLLGSGVRKMRHIIPIGRVA